MSTFDDGPQPVRWVGGGPVVAQGDALPIKIEAGALDNAQDLLVSGQHLLLSTGADCELLFGEPEVFAIAKDLVGLPGIARLPQTCIVRYHHLLLDRHQVLFAEGTGAESLHPGPMALAALPRRAQEDLLAHFLPYEIACFARQPAARRVLKSHEVWVLVARRKGAPMVPIMRDKQLAVTCLAA